MLPSSRADAGDLGNATGRNACATASPALLETPLKPAVSTVVARFRASHQEPDSPVRAIHHQAAREGSFAEIPAQVDGRLKTALEKRGIYIDFNLLVGRPFSADRPSFFGPRH